MSEINKNLEKYAAGQVSLTPEEAEQHPDIAAKLDQINAETKIRNTPEEDIESMMVQANKDVHSKESLTEKMAKIDEAKEEVEEAFRKSSGL